MGNKTKNPLRKHIWRAIGILLLGIIIGIGIAILFKETEGILGISSSIILSFLAVAFSYYQFYLNKFETEKREKENREQTEFRRLEDQRIIAIKRLSDLKLVAYKDIMKECNELVDNVNYLLYSNLVQSSPRNIENFKISDVVERGSIKMNLPHKLKAYNSLIHYYEGLLKLTIICPNYNKLAELIKEITLKEIGLYDKNNYMDLFKLKIAFNEDLLTTLMSTKTDY